jgi:hypothetical protein
MTLEEHLEKIESLLVALVEREQVREWYIQDTTPLVCERCGYPLASGVSSLQQKLDG